MGKEAAEKERDNLEKEKANLLSQALSDGEKQNKVAEMERTLKKLRDRNDELEDRPERGKLDAALEENRGLKEKNTELQAKLENLQDELEKKRREIEGKDREIENKDTEIGNKDGKHQEDQQR